ncbi:hypothetical protein AB205_0167640, partial [Aquarana catesbeiana]
TCIFFFQGKWKNKERVLIFSSRGINFRTRHLMQDLRKLMPHSKAANVLFLITLQAFDRDPYLTLLKELFTQIFGTPRYHPKSQPFVDHVFTFSIADKRIWFRNYQHRRMIRLATAAKVKERQQVKELQKLKMLDNKETISKDPTEDVFNVPAEKKPEIIETEPPLPKPRIKRKDKQFKRQRMAKKRV